MRHVLLYTDEDDNWIAEVPSLPGCHSDSRTREEAIERVKEAITVYIEALEEDGLPVTEEQATNGNTLWVRKLLRRIHGIRKTAEFAS